MTEHSPLAWLADVERRRRAEGLRRSLRVRPAVATELDLASNDYLGLTQHPDVIAGGVTALHTWGAGSGGSRLVTGNTELHEDFEAELDAVRARGYSTATAERVPGMTSVAAPVRTENGPVTAAIQVAGASEEISADRIESLGVEVQRAAYAVARRLF